MAYVNHAMIAKAIRNRNERGKPPSESDEKSPEDSRNPLAYVGTTMPRRTRRLVDTETTPRTPMDEAHVEMQRLNNSLPEWADDSAKSSKTRDGGALR